MGLCVCGGGGGAEGGGGGGGAEERGKPNFVLYVLYFCEILFFL